MEKVSLKVSHAKLYGEFKRRKIRNPRYSLRAYARDLGVSKTSLSDVLAGKRNFSQKAIIKLAESLGLDEDLVRIFKEEMGHFDVHESNRSGNSTYELITEDRFRPISDWYFVTILCLAQFSRNRADPNWIANCLGISVDEAAEAIQVLVRLKMIEVENGQLKRISPPFKIGGEVPSMLIREYHKQNLQLAERSIDNDSLDQRVISAISIPIDPSKIEHATQLIEEFKEKMVLMMKTDHPKEVYNLAIQFFPVTKMNRGDKS